MATSNATLAWSIPVRPDVLIAHLIARMMLEPTLTTLRLCHNFGQGDHAAINRLPLGLVAHIESYLVEEERATRRKEHLHNFRCWQSLCVPSGHVPKNELQEYFINMEDDRSDNESLCKLSAEQMADIDESLWEDDDREELWAYNHGVAKQDWRELYGGPSRNSGFLHQAETILLRDFGRGLWATQVQCDNSSSDAQTEHQLRIGSDTITSTQTYLTLPSMKHQFCVKRVEGEAQTPSDLDNWEVENGVGIPIEIPPQLSSLDLVKFNRALNILDLSVGDPIEHKELPEMHCNACETDITRRCKHEPLRSPKLRLLLRSTLDREDL